MQFPGLRHFRGAFTLRLARGVCACGAVCKHSDRVQWTKQGAVFGAALRFSQGSAVDRRENRLSARGQSLV